MSEDWIKLRKKLLNDPRTVGIAARLDTTEPHILGCLAVLWFTADSHADPETGFLEHYSFAKLDRLVCLDGFCEAVVDITKRHPDGPWLILRDNGVTFPDYGTHNGGTAKRRASEARRKVNVRSNCGQMSAGDADKCPQAMRTKSGPEKDQNQRKSNKPQPPTVNDALALAGYAGECCFVRVDAVEVGKLLKVFGTGVVVEVFEHLASRDPAHWDSVKSPVGLVRSMCKSVVGGEHLEPQGGFQPFAVWRVAADKRVASVCGNAASKEGK